MGVTTTNNKPFNPRGNDQSPLAYNKAAIYSGKALDFDGVNDVVTTTYTSGFTGAQKFTYCAYINTDNTAATQAIVHGNELVGWGLQSLWIENNKILFYAGTGSASTSYVASETLEANKWYFIVGTHTPTENKIYLNGVLNATATAANLTSAPQAITVGAYPNASLPFNGEITNVKVFNTALTPAQIADLYNFPEKIVPTGVANTALKLWLPMQEGAGTTAINGAPDALGSELITNGDFASNINDWAAKDSTIIWDNGKLKCDNSSGNGSGGPRQNVGLQNSKTYIFTATIQLVSASANGTFSLFTSTGVGTGQSSVYTGSTLVAGGDAITETGQFTTGTDGDVSIQFYVDRSSAVYTVDNVSVKELTNFGTISGATYVNGIGAPVAQTAVIDWNKHTLDGTNAVLIPQGLTSGRDLLGNLFEYVRKQGALNLDGNSYAEVHDNESLDMTTAVTLEAWVYWVALLDKGIVGKWDYNQNEASYLLYKASATRFIMYVSSNGTALSFETNDTDISSGWNHLVGVYDGANLKCYLNGVVDGSSAYSSGLYSNDSVVEIGRYEKRPSKSYTNQIAQPRIYNRALTAEEIQRNYSAGKNIYTN